MTTYIEALPKDLRDLLDYYFNYPYWTILNKICENVGVYSYNGEHGQQLLQHQTLTYFELNIHINYIHKKVEKYNSYRCYYAVPETQLITLEKLLEFLNNCYRTYDLKGDPFRIDYRIPHINEDLKNLSCKEQIVLYRIEKEVKYIAIIV